MKAFVSVVLAFVMCFSLSACGENEVVTNNNGNSQYGEQDTVTNTENGESQNGNEETATTGGIDDSEVSEIEHTGKKISGKITGASVFSEGLAFVCVNDDKEKTYCINEQGYIVFELDFRTVDAMGEIGSRFINGLAKVGEGICDTQGKLTMPSDVGATAFCDLALEGGYIIAEKVTSDFESSKKELGVMNTNFEWIVTPDEELYELSGGITLPRNTQCFYYDDYFYFENSGKYVNLKTGEIKDTIDSFPSKQWTNSKKCFYDYGSNEMLNLENHATLEMPVGSRFVNGKAPVRFINRETNKYEGTVIDEKGTFLFEPVETIVFQNFVFDGETVLILDQAVNPKTIMSYSIDGELLGQIKTDSIVGNNSFSCQVHDGVILLKAASSFKYTLYYHNTDFTPLFQ